MLCGVCNVIIICDLHRKLGDGLFIQCCEEVAKFYPKIQFDTMIIDNCCMQVQSLNTQQIAEQLQPKKLQLSISEIYIYIT